MSFFEGGSNDIETNINQQSLEFEKQPLIGVHDENVSEPVTLKELVVYENFVNEKKTSWGNFVGKLNYLD